MENPNHHMLAFSSDSARPVNYPMGAATSALNNMQPFVTGSYSYLQRQFVGQGHPMYDHQSQGQNHQDRDVGSFRLPGVCSSPFSEGSGLTSSSVYQLPLENHLVRSVMIQNPRMDHSTFMRGRQDTVESSFEEKSQALPSFSTIYASAASNISTMPMAENFQNRRSQSSCSPDTIEPLATTPCMLIKPIKTELQERSVCFATSSATAQHARPKNPSTQKADMITSSKDIFHRVTERRTSPAKVNSFSPTNFQSVNTSNQNLAEASKSYTNQYCMQDMQVNSAIQAMTQTFFQPISSNLQGVNQSYPINLEDVHDPTNDNKSQDAPSNFVNTAISVSPQIGNVNDPTKLVSNSRDSSPTEQLTPSCTVSEPLASETSDLKLLPKCNAQVLGQTQGSPINRVKPPKVFLKSCQSAKKGFVRFFVLGQMESCRLVSRGTSTEPDGNQENNKEETLTSKGCFASKPVGGHEQDKERNKLSGNPVKQELKERTCSESDFNEMDENVNEAEDSVPKSVTESVAPHDADDTMASVASEDVTRTGESSDDVFSGMLQENLKLSRSIQEDLSFDTSFDITSLESQSSTPKIRKKRLDIKVHIDDSQCIMDGNQKRWHCNMCEKSYTTKSNLITHILGHRGIKPHICLVCGRSFKQLSHLNTHMLKHDNLRPHICEICGKAFTQISHLKRHLVVHMDNKPHFCDICKRGFVYPSDFKTHKDKYPNGDCFKTSKSSKRCDDLSITDGEEIRCTECNKAFKYPSQLKDHMPTHSSVRPYICTECGLDFLKEHHLKAHQFTHTGLKPFECTLCGRAFNQKANLVRHQLIHSAKRDYGCEICDKSFTQPQTLKAHMVVHSEKKPYQCKLCGKGFGRLHNLQGHMHIHENSKPFICFCGCSFSLRGNLNRHKKVKHGLNETTENMEAEAVQLLKSFSERAKDGRKRHRDTDSEGPRTYLSNKNLTPIGFDDSCDTDDTENKSISLPVEDGTNLSPRKHRKSTPRKAVARESSPELDGDD